MHARRYTSQTGGCVVSGAEVCDVLDLDGWRSLDGVLSTRCGAAMSCTQDYVYIMGGFDGQRTLHTAESLPLCVGKARQHAYL